MVMDGFEEREGKARLPFKGAIGRERRWPGVHEP